jgi:hypothetical protein
MREKNERKDMRKNKRKNKRKNQGLEKNEMKRSLVQGFHRK